MSVLRTATLNLPYQSKESRRICHDWRHYESIRMGSPSDGTSIGSVWRTRYC